MLLNLGTIFKDQYGYLWEVSSVEGDIFGGRRYLRGKIEKNRKLKNVGVIPRRTFSVGIFTIKRRILSHGLPKFEKFCLRRQKRRKTVTKYRVILP